MIPSRVPVADLTPAEWAAAALKQAETAGVPVALVQIEHLRALLDELEQHRLRETADREAAQSVRAEWDAGRQTSGQCEDCSCCIASGCNTGPLSTCPTNVLGDSVCPCTGD